MTWVEAYLNRADEITKEFELRFLIEPKDPKSNWELIEAHETILSLRWPNGTRFEHHVNLDNFIGDLGGSMGALPLLKVPDYKILRDSDFERRYRELKILTRAKSATARINERVEAEKVPDYLKSKNYGRIIGDPQSRLISRLAYGIFYELFDFGDLDEFEIDYKISLEIESILRSGYSLCGLSKRSPDATFYVYG